MYPKFIHLKRFILGLSLLGFLASCQSGSQEQARSQEPEWIQHPEWKAYFDSAGVVGTIILLDEARGEYHVYDTARAKKPFLPASTFKILNSLVILETATLPDTNSIVAWDSVTRGYDKWNKGQNLAQAFRYSTVWLYQEMARRVGEERMQYWVDTAGYGNQDISGGIDMFWLTGGLRISAKEQVDFLRKLANEQLPFSSKSQQLVKGIMIYEQTAEYVFRVKTGWADAPDPDLGWFVGYLEKGSERWYFAFNCDMKGFEDVPAREGVSREILKSLGLM